MDEKRAIPLEYHNRPTQRWPWWIWLILVVCGLLLIVVILNVVLYMNIGP